MSGKEVTDQCLLECENSSTLKMETPNSSETLSMVISYKL